MGEQPWPRVEKPCQEGATRFANQKKVKQGRTLGVRCAWQASDRRSYGPTDGRTHPLTTAHLKRK